MKKIKVLIIDDSAVVRSMLREILSSDKDIEVVGAAMDPYIARNKIKKFKPDVLTLDVEMPKMDGISFLRNLMRLRPMPVVMISSLTEEGADIALEALGLGAFDYISKPRAENEDEFKDYSIEVISKVKAAAKAKIISPIKGEIKENTFQEDISINDDIDLNEKHTATAVLKKIPVKNIKKTQQIVAVGASTGGTEAIKDILLKMGPNSPAMVIVQHIPKAFSAAFAQRVNNICKINVCEAEQGHKLLPGHAFIAPGDKHLLIERKGSEYYCVLNDGEPVNRHKPSVDVLFRSVSQSAGANAIGILLTGMGADGASGLKEVHDTGAVTIVQDEQSSVVWGMPGEAVKLKAASSILPLDKIAAKLTTLFKN